MQSIRRKDREISSQEAVEVLVSAEYGILSTESVAEASLTAYR